MTKCENPACTSNASETRMRGDQEINLCYTCSVAWDMALVKPPQVKIPVVDVIASGYEWICPNCDKLNDIIEYPRDPMTYCEKCDYKVELDLPEHANG